MPLTSFSGVNTCLVKVVLKISQSDTDYEKPPIQLYQIVLSTSTLPMPQYG